MSGRNQRRGRILKTLLFVLGLCTAGLMFLTLSSSLARHGSAKDELKGPGVPPGVQLAPGTSDTLLLSPEAIQSLDMHAYEVKVARSHEHLRFNGQLFLDANRLTRVRSRFAGEVVSIGPLKPGAEPAIASAGARRVAFRRSGGSGPGAGGHLEQGRRRKEERSA